MKKQELIEKAVLAFEGKWLFPYENLVTPSPTNSGYAPYCKFESIRHLDSLGPHWSFVCTKEEFETYAKRMGYINGYRWGVEYPTNGRKPNLNGDVMCLVKFTGRPDFSQVDCVINNWPFDQTSHFKITDQRYKPVSEIAESKPDAESVSKNPESNWFEAGELPPIGEQCEWKGLIGGYWAQCEVIDRYQDKEIVVFNTGDYRNCKFQILPLDSVEFRPIRTDRDKFIDAAEAEFKKSGIDELVDFGFLYDAGFRLPESK